MRMFFSPFLGSLFEVSALSSPSDVVGLTLDPLRGRV